MRVFSLPVVLAIASSLLVVACGGNSDDSSDADATPSVSANNSADCPETYPTSGSCSPTGLVCTYAAQSGSTKPRRVKCLVEGSDGGGALSPRWWPLY